MATAIWSDHLASDAVRHVARLDAVRVVRALVAPLTGLSRVRGGTYSPTVGIVRFDDGTTAHTDLIRLNPNIDAYSLDFHGRSPRQLSHYRETHWAELSTAAGGHPDELLAILSHSYPHVSPRRLTERVRAAGYPIRHGQLPVHTIISATQSAIWHVTNGLDLDVQPLDVPVRVVSRTADGSARHLTTTGPLDWRIELRAARTVQLGLELPEAHQLSAYEFGVGPHTGHHALSVHLEQSSNGTEWSPVSSSQVVVPAQRHTRTVRRTLGVGATLHGAGGAQGQTGYQRYRLAVTGPADRDGFLDLRDVRLHLSAPWRFRNDEDVVHVYDYLLSHALGRPSRSRPELIAPHLGHHAATENPRQGPHRSARVHALVGSRTVDGPEEFTPLVVLTTDDRLDDPVSARRLADPQEVPSRCCFVAQTELA